MRERQYQDQIIRTITDDRKTNLNAQKQQKIKRTSFHKYRIKTNNGKFLQIVSMFKHPGLN